MLRQVSSRNQRVKGGFKMKNALHICLLVAVCVWLLYQMKHSHDKKKALDDQSSKSSFKGEERPPGIRKIGREVKPIGVPLIEEDERREDAKVEDEEEGSDGDPDIEEGSDTHEKGETKEVDGVEDREHDVSSHKAREISFRGDDASSEVVHIIQEVEHEEASQEARERSFKADDASSAVAHLPQANELESESENGGTRNIDEDELEKTDRRDGGGRDPAAHNNNSSTKRDATLPALNDVSSRNATTSEETKNHGGGQPDMRIASMIGNQTDKDRRSTESTMGNAVVLIKNSTSFSNQRIYFQKNSTTVSVEWVEAPANITAKRMDPTNATVSQYQTAAVPSANGQVNATKLETRGEEKPVIKQKTDATARREESEEIPKTSSATDRIGNAVQVESEKNVSGIQNRVQSGKQEAATAK